MEHRMKSYYIILTVFVSIFIYSGCAELESDINQPEAPGVHKPGISNPHSPNFHGDLIRENGWHMEECQTCHGPKYSGLTAPSCKTCHTAPAGPEACNTCHGSFTDPSRIAPPRSIDNKSNTDDKSVGAHSSHIYDNMIGARVRCSTCHNVPQSLHAPGHVDTELPAEVQLKGNALLFGAVNAQYNAADATCSNTYCHGNFVFYKDSASAENQFAYIADRMVGLNKTVDWTKASGSEAECGSCHGLPPEGHIQVPLTACASCHGTVVDYNGNIIDKTRHINGQVNVRQN